MQKAIKMAVPLNYSEEQITHVVAKREVFDVLNLSEGDIWVTGSFCKKPISIPIRDIDFIVFRGSEQIANLTLEQIKEKLKIGINPPEIRILKNLNIISFAFPIYDSANGRTDRWCQIDLIFVDNISYASWFYLSTRDSNYKGAHRNILLSVIASLIKLNVVKKYENIPVRWNRLYLEPGGLYWGIQSIEGKSGKPTTTRTTLKKEFISNKLGEVIKEILGENASSHDTDSFERVYNFIKSPKFPYKKYVPIILKRVKEIYENAEMIIPEEIKNV